MTVVKEAVQFLADLGLLDVVLPFILSFTVLYSVLERTKVLGENKQANAMVSFVVGFFTVAALQVVQLLQTLVPWIAAGLVFVAFVLFIATALGAEDLRKTHLPVALGFIVVGLLALYTLGLTGNIPFEFLEKVVLPLVLAAAVFVAMLYYITYEKKKPTPKTPQKPPEEKPKFVPGEPEEI
jgi:peptidoglycan/LPS O-acetylase OafA/YrhL